MSQHPPIRTSKPSTAQCLLDLHVALKPYAKTGLNMSAEAMSNALDIILCGAQDLAAMDLAHYQLVKRNDALEASIRQNPHRPPPISMGEIARRVIASEASGKVAIFPVAKRPTPFEQVELAQRIDELKPTDVEGALNAIASIALGDGPEDDCA